jgi:uncharacterized protein YjbI with pentapeptide repeats
MANSEHLEILKQGTGVWYWWRKQNPDIQPDLRDVDLNGIDLSEAILNRVNLRWANLSGANLNGAKLGEANLGETSLSRANLNGVSLEQANLSRADLSRTNLRGANLISTDLRGATLSEADLTKAELNMAILGGTNFSKAILEHAILVGAVLLDANLGGVDLSKAIVGYTTFGNADLREVKGLETVKHTGPSTIGVDTIYRSAGNIPEAFLRGAGVPDDIIALAGALKEKGVHYYSCFISYSSRDEPFTQRLHSDLQGNGVRCWFAPDDMKIGDKIRPTIDQSIRVHDKLLVILSENSMQSGRVEDEVETAIEEEKKRGGTVLFPIRLDETVMDTDQA